VIASISRVSHNRAEVPRKRSTRVGRSADHLLAVAVRMLPSAGRTRYAEEYRAELWDLAQSGAGRSRQLRYALRQLGHAIAMGRALGPARRRSALP
jgi:hypothetical protein